MSEERPKVGTVVWIDLTVDDATSVRDFYRQVVGWQTDDVDMGDYCDFSMNAPETGESAAGVCHKRDSNAELPSTWMIYIVVENVDESAARCTELGGNVLVGPKEWS
jgi:predicted enzyme related to lactoylglutathione lyase